VLPQTPYDTEHAEAGKGRHGEMEESIDTGDLSKLPDRVQALVAGLTVHAEVSVSYDTATGRARLIGKKLDRQYGELGPFEIPGTMDLLAIGNGRVVVGDWKGWKEVDHPDRNRQTMFYALCAALLYNVSEVTVAIAYLVAGHRGVQIATLDLIELLAYGDELKEMFVHAAQVAIDPHAHEVVSKHCEYCPAFLDCAKQNALKDEAANNLVASTLNMLMPFENDDDAAMAYEINERLGLLHARVKAALIMRAKQRPIPLRSGRIYGERQTKGKRTLDADKTYSYLREVYGQEVADNAVQRETAQAWIENAFRRAGVKQPGKTKDSVVAELDKLGAVTQKSRTVVEEFDPPQPQLLAANE
jgi:hypothetical protein